MKEIDEKTKEILADRFIKAIIEVLEMKYDVEIKYTLKDKN
ncbi:MAG: hypothetical protein ACI31S_02065 [Bacilli bacterium]